MIFQDKRSMVFHTIAKNINTKTSLQCNIPLLILNFIFCKPRTTFYGKFEQFFEWNETILKK